MFALQQLPEVQVAIAQPLVPALALGFSAMLGIEELSVTAVSGIVISIAGMLVLVSCSAFTRAAQNVWATAVTRMLLQLSVTD
jgi:drug/metabolite transporter (DMT)-like permease